jgi:RNA polymerase sigma-70 factor (ECF subfamily)
LSEQDHITNHTNRAVEAVARLSYGKLVAILTARTNDMATAEDALGDALLKALEPWPAAWLLTTARRRLIDLSRKQANWAKIEEEVAGLTATVLTAASENVDDQLVEPFPDERLKLLFVCAHPALDERIRAPLMLQAVLGVDARRIAAAFLMAPGTLGQRLVRAKAKILDAGMRFDLPPTAQLPERLDSVLDTIYAAYTLGWDALYSDDTKARNLVDEALWLGRLLNGLLPNEPEVLGLLALMLFCEARRNARRDPATGQFVPLGEQDPHRWSAAMINEAEQYLRHAGSWARPGRYQYEAAIQAVHADRRRSGVTARQEILLLYHGLVELSPTLGALLGYAAAKAACGKAAEALALLDALESPTKERYQPYWAVRAYSLAQIGDLVAAAHCYTKAAGLTEDAAVRAYLLAQRVVFATG